VSIYTHRTIIIVQASDQAAANQAAASMPGASPADLQAFHVGLSPTGAGTPTHYWCNSQFDDAHRQMVTGLQAQFPTAVVQDYDIQFDPTYPFALLESLGLQPIVGL
jgi:hypothetical protein